MKSLVSFYYIEKLRFFKFKTESKFNKKLFISWEKKIPIREDIKLIINL